MKNHTGRLLLLPLSLLLPACAEPTLREGLWELSYVDIKWRDRTDPAGKDFPLPARRVELLLEPGPEGTEMAQLNFVEEPEDSADGATEEEEAPPEGRPEAPVTPELAIKPMFADIRRTIEGKPPTVHVEARDGTWMWRMWGVILAPEEVDGTHFSAIHRLNSDVNLQGRWRLRWLGE